MTQLGLLGPSSNNGQFHLLDLDSDEEEVKSADGRIFETAF